MHATTYPTTHVEPANGPHPFGPSRTIATVLPGVVLTVLVAALAIASGQSSWLQAQGFSPLTVAILLGIVLGNLIYPGIAGRCAPGVTFSKQTLLRAGIILYGFRLTFQDIGHVGIRGVVIDAAVLLSTFGIALFLGRRVFGLDRTTSILIGAGSSICGAAAVMATEPVVRARADQVTVAVSTVVVFGTLAIFLYPLLYRLNLQWHVLATTPTAYGVFAGSTIHEVAQVVAAARAVGADAANTAVIAKMVRVMMLAPFLIALSALRKSGSAHSTGLQQDRQKMAIPWFAFTFIAMVGVHSLVSLPAAAVNAAISLDTLLLAMAMAGLGLTTHFSAIRRAGIRPLLLAALLFVWLIAGGALINRIVSTVLS